MIPVVNIKKTDSDLSGKTTRVYIYIALAFVLWFVMFVLKPFNFWLMMAFSTTLLSICSYREYKDNLKGWSGANVMIGIGSAILLYAVFFIGKIILDNIGIIPNHDQNISNVYANKGTVPGWLVAMLLFFPIGFGEEFFWRGCVQRFFRDKYNEKIAFYLTVFFYTAVHIPTMNPVLILASFIVGIYWGLIFMWRKSLVPGLISHMIWDPLIFVILPVT